MNTNKVLQSTNWRSKMAHITVKYDGEVMRSITCSFEAARALSLQLAFKDNVEVSIEMVK